MKAEINKVGGTVIIRGRVEGARDAREAIETFDERLYELGLRYVSVTGVNFYANPRYQAKVKERQDFRCVFIADLRAVEDFGKLLKG